MQNFIKIWDRDFQELVMSGGTATNDQRAPHPPLKTTMVMLVVLVVNFFPFSRRFWWNFGDFFSFFFFGCPSPSWKLSGVVWSMMAAKKKEKKKKKKKVAKISPEKNDQSRPCAPDFPWKRPILALVVGRWTPPPSNYCREND